MDEAVDDEEMRLMNHRHDEDEKREVNRMVAPEQPRHVSIGEAPQHKHLDEGPRSDTKDISA